MSDPEGHGLAPITRAQATSQVLAAKRRENLTFSEIATRLGVDRVWLTAALLGQHPLRQDIARRAGETLGLSEDVITVLQEIPTRGSFDALPTTYRLYEVLQGYGPALKALIHEDFGDGIMSAINFNIGLQRSEADSGPRVRITLEGKWLPYQWQP